jgi:8-oxo-dGTP diphosphatase
MSTGVTVAVGIVQDPQGRVLVSRRAVGAHQGGLWEFPGGKVESGEPVEAALARELMEELGVQVLASEALMVVEHDYGDKQVCLDVRRVTEWRGEARGLEGQPLAWHMPESLLDWAFPAANAPILQRLLRD